MRKFLTSPLFWIVAVSVLLIFAAFDRVYADEAADKQQRQMYGVSVQIDANCSGTLISSNRDQATGDVETLVLTAKHCVSDIDREYRINIPVYHKNRVVKVDSYVARVRGQYYKGDLALFELKDKQTWFANVARIAPLDRELRMGDPVWTMGYPLAMGLTVTNGSFGSAETIDWPKPGMEYYRATPNVVGGNSGGAMFHVSPAGDYEVIGVTSAVMNMASWMALYVTREDVHAYLAVAAPTVVGAATKPGL